MEKKNSLMLFFWQIISAHTISYFIAGIFALAFMGYKDLWATDVMSAFYRELTHPIIPLGSGLQIFRGIIVALVLLPMRKTFFEEKHGLIKLALIIFGFSIVSTYAAAVTSIEGLIYLSVPLQYHLIGIPEGLIWLSLFIGILKLMTKYSHKKIVLISSIVFVALICLMSIMGFMEYSVFFNLGS